MLTYKQKRELAKKKKNLAKYYTVMPNGCWESNMYISPSGYSQIRVLCKWVYLHIFMYEHYVGPVPDGLELDHLCRNRKCCNPEHQEPVTSAVNAQRRTTTKLTAEIVNDLRAGKYTGLQKDIAVQLGVAPNTISSAITAANWLET